MGLHVSDTIGKGWMDTIPLNEMPAFSLASRREPMVPKETFSCFYLHSHEPWLRRSRPHHQSLAVQ